mmetsp:Transcript_11054/g.50095  ORF Transcript_11054/g.50095 Transcript_11054/m.50095 type:complete len:376 (-) Transcript_11054:1029-2156(-)
MVDTTVRRKHPTRMFFSEDSHMAAAVKSRSRGNGSRSSRRPSLHHPLRDPIRWRFQRLRHLRHRPPRRMHPARTCTYSAATDPAPPTVAFATIFGAWTWRLCTGQTLSSLAMSPRRGGTRLWLSRLCLRLAPVARLSTAVARLTESLWRTRTALISRPTSGLASHLMRRTSMSSIGKAMEAMMRLRLPLSASPPRLPILTDQAVSAPRRGFRLRVRTTRWLSSAGLSSYTAGGSPTQVTVGGTVNLTIRRTRSTSRPSLGGAFERAGPPTRRRLLVDPQTTQSLRTGRGSCLSVPARPTPRSETAPHRRCMHSRLPPRGRVVDFALSSSRSRGPRRQRKTKLPGRKHPPHPPRMRSGWFGPPRRSSKRRLIRLPL